MVLGGKTPQSVLFGKKLRFLKITCNPLGTSAFGPSKTRRKIDCFFATRQKRLVKLTSVFEDVRAYCEK